MTTRGNVVIAAVLLLTQLGGGTPGANPAEQIERSVTGPLPQGPGARDAVVARRRIPIAPDANRTVIPIGESGVAVASQLRDALASATMAARG